MPILLLVGDGRLYEYRIVTETFDIHLKTVVFEPDSVADIAPRELNLWRSVDVREDAETEALLAARVREAVDN